MAKRKRSSIAPEPQTNGDLPPPSMPSARSRRVKVENANVNPDINGSVLDAPNAWRASPDSDIDDRLTPGNIKGEHSDSPLSDIPEPETPLAKKKSAKKPKVAKQAAQETAASVPTPAKKTADVEETRGDPEADDADEDADPEEIKAASLRPRPVNSDYLPLPWKGRLGYACLCTYLRYSNPPVFCSRTTRIASILEHRHPLKDPSQPEHATKNRPDKEQPADVRRGQAFIEKLCLANVADMSKLLRWNDRYGIRFLRLSSEAFPFASHAEYGYKLAPFAADALAEVGKVAAELGHRLTTHPGQFTQLGSPRDSVIEASIRDLEYHDEMLSLLKLPPQQDRDAVMILHMGGMFGDKAATLDRFRKNYARLSDSIKRRLVLENDDMCWGVHDLLPICQELNIPLCLDFHHHNIIFDADKIREGTKDIIDLFPKIRETWTRKNITQKMHYSEPTPGAVTGKQRRKHNPRVATLPPCPPDMDLMIEAKDKEQAVFELMRTFKLPGWNTFNDVIPYTRQDDNKPVRIPKKKATPKKKPKKPAAAADDDDAEPQDDETASLPDDTPRAPIPDDQVGMGGPDGRVYWPPGMEEWLRPVKRVVKRKEPAEGTSTLTPAQKKIAVALAKAELAAEMQAKKAVNGVAANGDVPMSDAPTSTAKGRAKAVPKSAAAPKRGRKAVAAAGKGEATPTTSDDEAEESFAQAEQELRNGYKGGRAAKGRRAKGDRVSYAENEEEDDEEE